MLALFTASGAMLGFVLAASTFLLGHVENERFALLRRSGGWAEFPRLVRSCIWRLMALTAVTYICTFTKGSVFIAISPLIVFIGMLTLMSLSALIWVTTSIMSIR
jgi:hypothetical protein